MNPLSFTTLQKLQAPMSSEQMDVCIKKLKIIFFNFQEERTIQQSVCLGQHYEFTAKARLLCNYGEIARAKFIAEKILDIDCFDFEATNILARYHLLSGQIKAAAELIQSVSGQSPENPFADSSRACIAFLEKNFTHADFLARKVLQQNPTDYLAIATYCFVLQTQEVDRTRSNLSHYNFYPILREAEKEQYYWNLFAWMLLFQDKYDYAVSISKQVLKEHPQNYLALQTQRIAQYQLSSSMGNIHSNTKEEDTGHLGSLQSNPSHRSSPASASLPHVVFFG